MWVSQIIELQSHVQNPSSEKWGKDRNRNIYVYVHLKKANGLCRIIDFDSLCHSKLKSKGKRKNTLAELTVNAQF